MAVKYNNKETLFREAYKYFRKSAINTIEVIDL